MPTVYIGTELLKTIERTANPPSEVMYRDTHTKGFHIRRAPSGRCTYAMQLRRGKSHNLGPVGTWESPEAARTAAIKALAQHRDGQPVTVARPDAPPPTASGLTLRDVFGLRENVQQTGNKRHRRPTEGVVGLYRTLKRRGRASLGNRELVLDTFVAHVGPGLDVARVTRAHVESWTATLVTADRNERSAAQYLTTLRTACKWAKRKGYMPANPCDDVTIEREKDDTGAVVRWLDADEERRLRGALRARDARIRSAVNPSADRPSRVHCLAKRRERPCKFVDYLEPLVLLSLLTGGRQGGMCKLRWHDIKSAPYPHVEFVGRNQKKRQTYRVALNREARQLLRDWRPADAHDDDLVFPSPLTGGVLNPAHSLWAAVLRDAKIVRFRWHDLRHSFASNLVQRGVPLVDVAAMMGHKDLRMTARYAHLDPRGQLAHVERLSEPAPVYVRDVDIDAA